MKLSMLHMIDEMALKAVVAGDRDAQGRPWKYDRFTHNRWATIDKVDKDADWNPRGGDRTSETEKRSKMFNAWSSAKFLRTLSEKLSRLHKYDILLFVGGNLFNSEDFWAARGRDRYDGKKIVAASQQAAADKSGIPIEEIRRSIVVNLTGSGGGQDMATPWIILHQVAEAIIGNRDNSDLAQQVGLDAPGDGADFWMSVHDRCLSLWYDAGSRGAKRSFSEIFKFKSAASILETNGDMDTELLTEYLWHGGKIRKQYPPRVPPEAVDKAIGLVSQICDNVLASSVGRVFDNAADER